MSSGRLQVMDARGQRISVLDRPALAIGRRATADLTRSGADVSRDHAEIVREGEQYRLRDRGSRHGTYVNGEQVTEHLLVHGDAIRFGRSG
ncbi:MAG: FHA domain-containing protein, partial [Vicinamibacterales bacterium]